MKKSHIILLMLILLLAAGLRFYKVNWDQSSHLHPDERFLLTTVNDIKWPKNVSEYFNTELSSLNPANNGKTFFVYGTFPVFLNKLITDILQRYGYDPIVGRVLSGIFDILTIFFVFLIARQLFDIRTALLSAFFLAIAVTHIQHSHFFVVDLFATFFVVLSFYLLIMFLKTEKVSYAILLGISWGFGLASKINVILFGAIIALGCLVLLIRKLRTGASKAKLQKLRAILSVVIIGLVICLMAFIVFRLFQPYAFAGPNIWNVKLSDHFISNLKEQSQLSSEGSLYPPAYQWYNRSPFFQAINLTLWGFGLPLSIAVWLGLLIGIYQLLFKKKTNLLLIIVWILFILIFQALQFVKTLRYILPSTPFLIILSAFFISELVQASRKWPKASRYCARGFVIFLIAGSLLWTFAFMHIYVPGVSRVRALDWVGQNIPANSTVANEHWDDPLWLPIFKGENLALFDGDEYDSKIEKISDQLSRSDYLFITSNRLYMAIPRRSDLYPMTSRYYRLLFNESLGYKLEKTFTNYPTLFGIEINDDYAEEAFTVYDHPKVLIFGNDARLSPKKIQELLQQTSTPAKGQ